jgi:hypothetical protein
MFLQEIMHLNVEVALSLEDVMQENHGALSMCKFTSKGGKDQGVMMKYS